MFFQRPNNCGMPFLLEHLIQRLWWTSSDGNDFANTFDIKLISVWLTCCGFINYLYYICPRKRKCKSYYLYNDPKEA